MVGHRADDEQDVGLARRRRDEEAEAVHVVVGVVEQLDLVQAGAAAAGVHDADVERAAEGRLERRRCASDRRPSPTRSRPSHVGRRLDAARAAEAVDAPARSTASAAVRGRAQRAGRAAARRARRLGLGGQESPPRAGRARRRRRAPRRPGSASSRRPCAVPWEPSHLSAHARGLNGRSRPPRVHRGQDDREVLEREGLDAQVEPVPVGERAA